TRVSARFPRCVESQVAVSRLETVAGAEQIQKRLIADWKSLDHGVAKDGVTRADGRVLIHNELQKLLVAAKVKGVIAEDRFDLDVRTHRQSRSQRGTGRLTGHTPVEHTPVFLRGPLFGFRQRAYTGGRSIEFTNWTHGDFRRRQRPRVGQQNDEPAHRP